MLILLWNLWILIICKNKIRLFQISRLFLKYISHTILSLGFELWSCSMTSFFKCLSSHYPWSGNDFRDNVKNFKYVFKCLAWGSNPGAKLLQPHSTLCSPMDCSPGSTYKSENKDTECVNTWALRDNNNILFQELAWGSLQII